MLLKILSFGVSGLVSLVLLGMMPAASQESEQPSAQKQGLQKKGESSPERDLQRAYHLLRRLRADSQVGRPDARIREWTERATTFYREGIRALREENPQLAHENAIIAQDLARAIDHMRNAMLDDRPDADLPPPPARAGSGRDANAHRELTKAYQQLREEDDGSDAGPEAKYYRDAATELYRAALRDFESGRADRAGELARAAEAMRRVCEHLGHAADVRKAPPPNAEPKTRPESE